MSETPTMSTGAPGTAVPPGMDPAAYDAWLKSLPQAPGLAHTGPEQGSAVRTPHSPHPHPHADDQGEQGEQGPHTALPVRSSDTTGRLPEWLPDRLAATLRTLGVQELPEVLTDRAPSLSDLIDYATKGPWTALETGGKRTAYKLYVKWVAIPVIVAARLAAWAIERPARAAYLYSLALIVGSALSCIPVIDLFIPNAINITAWF